MRLLIIGSLGGQIGEASQIAASRGALVSQANDVEAGLNSLIVDNFDNIIFNAIRQATNRSIEISTELKNE